MKVSVLKSVAAAAIFTVIAYLLIFLVTGTNAGGDDVAGALGGVFGGDAAIIAAGVVCGRIKSAEQNMLKALAEADRETVDRLVGIKKTVDSIDSAEKESGKQ